MPTWEARVSRATAPADRVDAELRYAYAAPLVRDAALWVDLGCGTGVAAGAALALAMAGSPGAAPRALLVDRSADALAEARRECGADVIAAVEADLETAEGVAAVRAALAEAHGEAGRGDVVVTCFDVLHQLADVSAVVELLVAVSETATVILSVPDDAAGALDDPERASAWSAGAAEELRRLVAGEVVTARQVPVRASAIVLAGGETAPLGAVAVQDGQPAAHHLLAFGPGAARLVPVSGARAAELDAERADVRRRESDLAYLEARVAQLETPGAA
jgi:SAM-dependent methyltransferase